MNDIQLGKIYIAKNPKVGHIVVPTRLYLGTNNVMQISVELIGKDTITYPVDWFNRAFRLLEEGDI